MKQRIGLLIGFAFIATAGFSQDPAAKKTIYQIPASEVKPSSTSTEPVRVIAEKKSVHACEIDKTKKVAIVTTKIADGSVSTETYELKSEKK